MATVIPQIQLGDLVRTSTPTNVLGAIQSGLTVAGTLREQQQAKQQQQALIGQQQLGEEVATSLLSGQANPQAMARLLSQNPDMAAGILKQAGIVGQRGRDQLARTAFEIESIPAGPQRDAKIQQIGAQLQAQGRDPNLALGLIGLPADQQNKKLQSMQLASMTPQQIQAVAQDDKNFALEQQKFGLAKQRLGLAQTLAARGPVATAAQREFTDLTEGLTDEQKAQAKLIKLGLSPRAVGSSIQTISAQGLAEQIGNVEAIIKERAKFGELTGASRSKSIDAGFETIRKIDKNVNNLDRAIAAVEAGAGTGAIERRFPSIKAASVQLDQIQGELALDVVGAVTFGALSEGELNLAKNIALPTGLDGPQLIKHLQDKKSAQQKLRGYFNEQIQFLDQGGSVAGFLRQKERTAPAAPEEAPDTSGTAEVSPASGVAPVTIGRFKVEVLN